MKYWLSILTCWFICVLGWASSIAQLPENKEISRREETDSVKISQRNWPDNTINMIQAKFESGLLQLTTHVLENKIVSIEIGAMWTDLEGRSNLIQTTLKYEGAGDWSIEFPMLSRSAEPDSSKMWKEKPLDQPTSTSDSLK